MKNHPATTIRPANIEDVPCLIQLERKCPTVAHWTEQQYHGLFVTKAEAPYRLALVAEGVAPPDVLGFLVARNLPPEWEIENIVVAPAARRMGIGSRLVDTLGVRAKQTNSDAVFLEVRESNTAARRLYEKLGFRETGRRKSYYSNPFEDAVLYTKKLLPHPISD